MRLIFLLSALVAASVPFYLKFKGPFEAGVSSELPAHSQSLHVDGPFRFSPLDSLKFHTCLTAWFLKRLQEHLSVTSPPPPLCSLFWWFQVKTDLQISSPIAAPFLSLSIIIPWLKNSTGSNDNSHGGAMGSIEIYEYLNLFTCWILYSKIWSWFIFGTFFITVSHFIILSRNIVFFSDAGYDQELVRGSDPDITESSDIRQMWCD